VSPPANTDLYSRVIARIFQKHYAPGAAEFYFERAEITAESEALGIPPPRNVGDLIYSFRFRHELPSEVTATAPEGKLWIIELAGRGRYRFRLASSARIEPNPALLPIKIPDATPEIILKYAQSDEQALLAKVRYNRLIDIFLSVAAYSLQNHLRTTVEGMGQIEIDEVYVAVNSRGAHFVVPVQAKSGSDQIGVVQTSQDVAFCQARYPELIARPLAAQFMRDDVIAVFELALVGGEIGLRREEHYRLVPASEISNDDLRAYRTASGLDSE